MGCREGIAGLVWFDENTEATGGSPAPRRPFLPSCTSNGAPSLRGTPTSGSSRSGTSLDARPGTTRGPAVTVWSRRTRHGSPTSCAPLGSGRAPGEAHRGPVVPERPGRTVFGVDLCSAHRVSPAEAGAGDGGPAHVGVAPRGLRACRRLGIRIGSSSAGRVSSAHVAGPDRLSIGTHRVAGARECAPENEIERLSSMLREFFRPRAHGVPDERRSWSSTSGIRMRCSLLRVVDRPGLRRRRRKRSPTEVRGVSPDTRGELRESAIKRIFYRSAHSVPLPKCGSDAVTTNVPGRPYGWRRAWRIDRDRACPHQALPTT
jgi:hypothetical protein